ncbi:hypothetical protein Tco_0548791 [Tanacetum coccineum]
MELHQMMSVTQSDPPTSTTKMVSLKITLQPVPQCQMTSVQSGFRPRNGVEDISVEEWKRYVLIKGEIKRSHPTQLKGRKPSKYLCCQISEVDANIENDIMGTQCAMHNPYSHRFHFSSGRKLDLHFVMEIQLVSIEISL